MSGRTTKVAQVGCGHWGPNLARNVATNPHADLTAICDVDPTALQRVASKYPDVAQFTSYGGLLAQVPVDAVVIATPSRLHFEHTLAALRAGKHVLVEKPMGTSVAQAVELVRVAEDVDRILMVGHTFLYNNLVRQVKRFIDEG
jgi:predicted dehydrogenase